MVAELLINVTPSETRVAMIEAGILQEVHIEREVKRSIVGNIYKGKVSRVLPGMQAAFVDIGLEKDAFLHAFDISSYNDSAVINDKPQYRAINIATLVRPGQDIIVQVLKEPLGTKGARITTEISLPSRYMVFIPNSNYIGISQRIENECERERLKNIVSKCADQELGFIVRTAAEGASENDLANDIKFLKRLWNKILERKKRPKTKVNLYGELNLSHRILRDFVGTDISKIIVDSKLTLDNLVKFTSEFVPELTQKISLYKGSAPIFDMYDVETDIGRSLERKVKLKSGGYLVIDQTEALTTIDINTGAFVGRRDLADTIFNINLEATKAIARQLRVRNLGGMILIDFIDMISDLHRKKVLTSLEDALAGDRVKTNIHGFTQLGLVEITRKRTRESIEKILCTSCSACEGRGHVKTVETVSYEILREITRVSRAYDANHFIVYASSAVVDTLQSDGFHAVAELELFIGRQIKIKAEHLYTQEQFDVVIM